MLDAGSKLAGWEILSRPDALICSTRAPTDTKHVALEDRISRLGRPADEWYPRLGASLEALTTTVMPSWNPNAGGPWYRTVKVRSMNNSIISEQNAS